MNHMADAVRERGRTLDLSAAPPHRARGNSKLRRWCRGKVGVPHNYRWTVDSIGLNVERCIGCGKGGRYCFGGKCICGSPEDHKR